MERLSATDALFAYADKPDTPMNMGSVQVLRLPPNYQGDFFDDLKQFIAERLQYIPKLSKRLVVDLVGLPRWEDVEAVDLDHHIRRTRVRSGDPQAIAKKLGRLQHIPFDFSRPLFLFYLIEGLEDGRVILLQKFHHTVADGKTAIRIMDLFSDEGLASTEKPAPPEAPKAARGLLRRTINGTSDDLKRGWDSLRALAGASPTLLKNDTRDMMKSLSERPVTVLNQPLSDRRLFVFRNWPLDRVQRIRRQAGLTFNDFGLVLLGGALRRYLDELDTLPEATLVCNVPVALEARGSSSGNSVLSMWVPLGTHLADARERATYVKDEAGRAKRVLQSLLDSTAVGPGLRLPSLMVRGMALTLSSARLARLNPPPGNVAMSNVPAPQKPIHVAGALVESLYGMPMLLQGQAVGTTFSSYAGQVVAGLLCCEAAVPDPERILDYMEEEIDQLDKAYAAEKSPGQAKRPPRRRKSN